MDSNLLHFVRRFWILLLAGAILGGVAAHVFATRITPTYEAAVQLLVGPINADFDTQRASGTLARTYADLATSGPIIGAAAGKAGVDKPLDELRTEVRSTSNDVTRILTVRARAENAEKARAFATAIAQELIRVARRPRAGAPGGLRIVDPAERPREPISPQITLITALGAFAGLLVAGTVLFLREASTERVDEQALEAFETAPFLGSVRPGVASQGAPLAGDAGAKTRAADRYRLVAAKMDLSDSDLKTLLAVGADDGLGAGDVVVNAASVLPELVPRVTLVDATTAGEITRRLGLVGHPGYTDLLETLALEANGLALGDYSVAHGPAFTVIPRGTGAAMPYFDAALSRELIQRLRSDGSIVVIHSPPIEQSAATLGWARLADGAVIVARRRKTRRADVERTLTTLTMTGANVIGTILRA